MLLEMGLMRSERYDWSNLTYYFAIPNREYSLFTDWKEEDHPGSNSFQRTVIKNQHFTSTDDLNIDPNLGLNPKERVTLAAFVKLLREVNNYKALRRENRRAGGTLDLSNVCP